MEKYSVTMRVMHWLVGGMIIALLSVGFWMTSLPNDFAGKYDFYDLHKSFGLTAFALVLLRVVVRLNSKVPSLDGIIGRKSAMLAALVVLLFYGAMLLMPLSGYLMSSFGGYTIHLFGIKLPEWIAPNQDLGRFAHSAHAFGGWFFVTCIGLHVMGTLKHFLLDRVNLLKRMW